MSKIIHVLLTGGVGSRLWPLSRKSRPKQYIDLFGGYSLFELSVKRNSAFTDKLNVVGNIHNQDLSVAALKKLGKIGYSSIVEATPRNTAPAITFAALEAKPDDILLVTPADHIIKEGESYESAIKKAIRLAEDGQIVCFGIRPEKPETGYGYIEHDDEDVVAFREKPDLDTAMSFLKKGNFLWNSGMFCFKAGVFLEELKKFEPEVYAKSMEAWFQNKNGLMDLETSLKIPSISVDYAVMERSEKIKVVKSDFEWSDMGSFDAIYDYLKAQGHPVDENGNMVIGSENYTAFVGLQDSILVCTSDANLVLSREQSQDVKKVYSELESSNSILV
ncbi:mannose-1-phosphate guanylyltransferase [Christiangramia salexigens]|uniref:Mannose-1-phosphate guanylyltransferase n=1 Tax=Christiangramia salexigens TaxID=1913577 RepID=A0A1L3J5M0_9FLAO|nr:sugar phosphate nucleotidyltransferase [Christiangramia salexigens]APG60435.1 mannose-1-phosphate guanylyltransferase [Christiangramia salexigens]